MYKYKLEQETTRYFPWLKDGYQEYDFAVVDNGHVTIKKNYSWDGATPKIKIRGRWFGVSDGEDDLLKTDTLWHDVLTQYGIGKKTLVDAQFLIDMTVSGWKYAQVYYYAVRFFGWIRWNRSDRK